MTMTPRQRWQAKRDAVIRSVSASGLFSQRYLADVFDLVHGRVGAILAGAETGRPRVDAPARAATGCEGTGGPECDHAPDSRV